MIVVQRIETTWTKISRGMPNAALRNSVPRVMEIPSNSGVSENIYVHEIKASEDSHFKTNHETFGVQDHNKYWSLSFTDQDGVLEVMFTYNYSDHGKPDRGAHRRPLFNLKEGETGVLHINGRFASYSGQYYKQHFVNVAHVIELSSDIFIKSEPVKFVNKMVDLF